MRERIVDQILRGYDGFFWCDLHGVGWNDLGLDQSWTYKSAAESILDQQLIQFQLSLRHDERLLVGGYLALSTNDFDRSQGADFYLLLVIGESLFGELQSVLLDSYVLEGIYEIPVHVLNLVNRCGDLEAEGNIRDLAVVMGKDNEASVGQEAEALQQVLRQLEPEI